MLVMVCFVSVLMCIALGLEHFWQVTDVHYDMEYTTGAPNKCLNLQCCRKNSHATDDAKPAGFCGDHNCYQPIRTLNQTFQFMKNHGKGEFVVWNMDVLGIDVFDQTKEKNIEQIRSVVNLMKSAFPKIKVFPVIGNHDSWPDGEFNAPEKMQWLLESFRDMFRGWLSQEALDTFVIAGYYSDLVEKGIRIIGLNHVYYDIYNLYSYNFAHEDVGGMKEWLRNELKKAKSNNEKVIICAHEPPTIKLHDGVPNMVYNYTDDYFKIIDEYNDIIITQLFGHTHREELYTFPLHNPNMLLYVASAATTKDNNPTTRLYHVNKNKIVDYDVYALDVDKCNAERKYTYTKLYSLLEYYGLDEITPESWSKMLDKFTTDNELWNKFYKVIRGGVPLNCDENCRRMGICAMRSRTENELNECLGYN